MNSERGVKRPTRISAGTVLHGGIDAAEDVIVEGRVFGHLALPAHHLSIHRSGEVRARVVARVVTLAGTFDGSIMASERVELLPGADVRGHVKSPSLLMLDGARFTGTVDPERSEAAMHVARYRARAEPAAP